MSGANIVNNRTYAFGRENVNTYSVMQFNTDFSSVNYHSSTTLVNPLNYVTYPSNKNYFWLVEMTGTSYWAGGLHRVSVNGAFSPTILPVAVPSGKSHFTRMSCPASMISCYVGLYDSSDNMFFGQLNLDRTYGSIWSINVEFREVSHRRGSTRFYLSEKGMITVDISFTPASSSYIIASSTTEQSVKIAPIGTSYIIIEINGKLSWVQDNSSYTLIADVNFKAWDYELVSTKQIGDSDLAIILFWTDDNYFNIVNMQTRTLTNSPAISQRMFSFTEVLNTTLFIICSNTDPLTVVNMNEIVPICHGSCKTCSPYFLTETGCVNCYPPISLASDGRCSINCPVGCKMCDATNQCF